MENDHLSFVFNLSSRDELNHKHFTSSSTRTILNYGIFSLQCQSERILLQMNASTDSC